MSTSWMKPAMFAAGGILLLTVGTSAWAGRPPICKTTGDPGTAKDCCASGDETQFVSGQKLDCSYATNDGELLSEQDMDHHPNIFVFLADDQGYCQYGFMQGYCSSNPAKSCQTRLDCPDPANDDCLRVVPKDDDTSPLRLNEWSCRYRQRPSPEGNACPTNKKGDKGGPNAAFPFNSNDFPCTGTDTNLTNPGALTPHLDALAKEGAVFTRAHVSGNSCKPSRSTMTFGRHHRHSQWHYAYRTKQETDGQDRKDWTPDPIGRVLQYASYASFTNPALQLPIKLRKPYARFLLGKGEVVGVDDGGFNAGFSSSGPKDGKFTCEGDTACVGRVQEALDDNEVPHDSRGLPGDPVHPDDPESPPPGKLQRLFDLLFTDDLVNDSRFEPSTSQSVIEVQQHGEAKTARQVRPFFFWFAPRMPHMGGTYGSAFREAEFAGHGDDQKQLGRVAETDLALGAVVDELKRTCVCLKDDNDQPQPHNLYENTVIIYLADHGLYMPKTKHTSHENNHRTPIIIDHPHHRPPYRTDCTSDQCNGPVIEDQFAHSTDLVLTVVDLAGLDMPDENDTPPDPPLVHPFWNGSAARNRYTGSLKAAALGTGSIKINGDQLTGVDRPMQFGEWAAGKSKYFGADPSEARRVYVIPRPDHVGICVMPGLPPDPPLVKGSTVSIQRPGDSSAVDYPKPCIDNTECTAHLGEYCERSTIGRCINNPTQICDLTATGGDWALNRQCAPLDGPMDDICYWEDPDNPVVRRCRTNSAWSLGDFARPGTTGDVNPASKICTVPEDCIPKDKDLSLCRRPMLKIVSSGVRAVNAEDPDDPESDMRILEAYDLDVDPDQTFNLLNDKKGGNPNYLGTIGEDGTLGDAALDCLRNFWNLGTKTGPEVGEEWENVWTGEEWNPGSNNCSLLEDPPTTTSTTLP